MEQLQEIYNQVMSYLPVVLRPYASIALGLLLAFSILQVIKRNFVYLVVLVVLLPASIPILKSTFEAVVNAMKFLFGMH